MAEGSPPLQPNMHNFLHSGKRFHIRGSGELHKTFLIAQTSIVLYSRYENAVSLSPPAITNLLSHYIYMLPSRQHYPKWLMTSLPSTLPCTTVKATNQSEARSIAIEIPHRTARRLFLNQAAGSKLSSVPGAFSPAGNGGPPFSFFFISKCTPAKRRIALRRRLIT